LLYLVDFLEPQAYLDLSSTCRTLRRYLKQPEYLRRVVLYPQAFHLPRAWETRISNPLFEQLVLQTTFVQRARKHPLRCAILLGAESKYTSDGLSLSKDGRYAAYVIRQNARGPPHYAVCLYDIFANTCCKLEGIVSDWDEDSWWDPSLHSEHDLVLLDSSGKQSLWDLNNLSAPIHVRARDEDNISTITYCGLASHCKYLVCFEHGRLSLLDVGALKRRSKDTTTLSWTGVQVFAYSSTSPNVLLSTSDHVEHWSVEGEVPQLVRRVEHSHFSGRPVCLKLSPDGNCAITHLQPQAPPWGIPQDAYTWTLTDAPWSLTRFAFLGAGEECLLSSDGRFLAYDFTVPENVLDPNPYDPNEPDDEHHVPVVTLVHDLHQLKAKPLAIQAAVPYVDLHLSTHLELLFEELRQEDSCCRQKPFVSDQPDACDGLAGHRFLKKRLQEFGVQYLSLSWARLPRSASQEEPTHLCAVLEEFRLDTSSSVLSPSKQWAIAVRDRKEFVILPAVAPRKLFVEALAPL
jgi:hypothetical protein